MEAEMEAEMRCHMAACIEDQVRAGVPRREAERLARVEFGAIESFKEECRQARGVRFWDELNQDLRYSFRTLRKSPGFTAVAALTLAVGIGANAAVFTAVDSWVLRPLPFPASERLVAVWASDTRRGGTMPATQALFVLVVSGLLIKSMDRIYNATPGFETQHLLTARVALAGEQSAEPARVRAFYEDVLERIRLAPDVKAAGAVQFVPFGLSNGTTSYCRADRPAPPPGEYHSAEYSSAIPGYLDALGLRLVRGRWVAKQDRARGVFERAQHAVAP